MIDIELSVIIQAIVRMKRYLTVLIQDIQKLVH